MTLFGKGWQRGTATAKTTAGSFDKLRTGSSTPLRFAQDDKQEKIRRGELIVS
jgi:hypothetical protein